MPCRDCARGRCVDCGNPGPVCDQCGACWSCCTCDEYNEGEEDDARFDRDELGIDPDEDYDDD